MAVGFIGAFLGVLAVPVQLVALIVLLYVVIRLMATLVFAFSGERHATFAGAWQQTRGNVGSFAWFSVLLWLVFFASSLMLAFAGAFLAAYLNVEQQIATMIGWLLAAPGLITLGYLATAYSIFVLEGRRGLDALVRSTQLVHGRWLSIFIRVFAVLILVEMISYGCLVFLTELMGELAPLISGFVNLVLIIGAVAALGLLARKMIATAPAAPLPIVGARSRVVYAVMAIAGVIGVVVFAIAFAVALNKLAAARQAAIEAYQQEVILQQEAARAVQESDSR